MSVSSTATFELDVASIIKRALNVAGLLEASQTPRDADVAMARELLNMELDALQADGLLQRSIVRTTQTLTASTASYTLSAEYVDVVVGADNVVGTIVPSSGAETQVYAMSGAEYLAMSDKTSTATPTRVYVEKTATLKLIFWPIPPTTPGSFRYRAVQILRDATTSSTPDVDRKRAKALVWSLAYDLAVAKMMGVERCGMLRSERDRLKAIAKADDVERGHAQFVLY